MATAGDTSEALSHGRSARDAGDLGLYPRRRYERPMEPRQLEPNPARSQGKARHGSARQ